MTDRTLLRAGIVLFHAAPGTTGASDLSQAGAGADPWGLILSSGTV